MNLIKNEKTGANTHELIIQTGKEEFEQAVEKTYHQNKNKVQIPGFRKGKASRKQIEKLYGTSFFYEQAVNESYPAAYKQAIEESGVKPIDQADIDITEINENGYTFKATVTVEPEVTIGQYKGIEVPKSVSVVSDDEVDAEIEKTRQRNSRLITAEDKVSEMGDTAVIDFEGFLNGVPFEGGKGDNFSLKLGSGQFIPGFEEQVVGKKAGESFDVVVTFPEQYQSEELAGKEVVFKVTVNEVKYTELPTLDDEFAKDVSEFDTLAEYKEDNRIKMQDKQDKMNESAYEEKLIDIVIDGMQAEIPQVMIDRQTEQLLQDFDQRMRSQGMDLKTYMQYTGMDLDAMRGQFTAQAERQVKIRLASEKIVEIEGIKATEDEINAEFEKAAKAYNMDLEKIKSLIPAYEMDHDISVSKAIDLIKENAITVNDVEVAKPKAKKSTKNETEAAEEVESTSQPKKTRKKTNN